MSKNVFILDKNNKSKPDMFAESAKQSVLVRYCSNKAAD